MSEFLSAADNKEFVKEFAYRTKLNYYYAKLLSSQHQVELANIANESIGNAELAGKIQQIQEEMKQKNYAISNFYEVTQLINSLIGLLVFPQQAYFEKMSKDLVKNRPDFHILAELMESDFIDTYKFQYDNPVWKNNLEEKRSVKNILRHLRNSVSHDKVMIHPINAGSKPGQSSITDVVFCDSCRYYFENNKWRNEYKQHLDMLPEARADFQLKVPVEYLEPLLIEINDYFIGQ